MKANSIITASIVLGFLLGILKLPANLLWLRPDFVLMVLVYWALALPERFGLLAAVLVGLFQDSFTGTLLGTHMLCYGAVVAFILFTYQRLRMMGVWQQAFLFYFLFVAERFLEYRIEHLSGIGTANAWLLLSPLTSALLWPWLMVSLRAFRLKSGMAERLL